MFRKYIFYLILFIPAFSFGQEFKLVKTLIGHTTAVMLSKYSPDGNLIVSGDLIGNIIIWDAKTYNALKILKGHKSAINTFDFDKTCQFLVSAGDDGMVIIWNINTGDKYMLLNVPFGKNSFATFSPDQRYLYFGGTNFSDGNHSIYKLEIGRPTPYLVFKNKYYVTSGIISYDNNKLIFSSGFTLKYLDFKNDSIHDESIACGGYINTLAVYQDKLVSWCEDGTLNFWNPDGTISQTIVAGAKGFTRISFSQNGKWLIAGTGDLGNTAKIWDTEKKEVIAELIGHQNLVKSAYFSVDDKNIMTSSYDGTIKIWEIIPENKPEIVYSKLSIPEKLGDRKVAKQSEVKINSPHLELFVWDREVADGDSISLNINGKWVLEKYELVKEKKSISIDLNPESNNYLILYAHNLGKKPPNTAAVSFFDGKREKILTLKSDLKNCGAINFVYKKSKQKN